MFRARDLSLSNARIVLGAIPARLSLAAKIRFPETETGFLETGSKAPLIEQEDRASGAASTTRQAGRSVDWFLYHEVVGLQWQL